MREHAPSLQANAMVGVRFAATEVIPGLTEVLCYGSAVVVNGTPERVAEDIRHGRQGKEVGRTDPYPTP